MRVAAAIDAGKNTQRTTCSADATCFKRRSMYSAIANALGNSAYPLTRTAAAPGDRDQRGRCSAAQTLTPNAQQIAQIAKTDPPNTVSP